MTTVREMKASARPRAGKGAARAERRAGRVPGVIYGNNQDPVTISVDHAELKQRIYAGRFLTTIYELDVDGTKHRVIPRDFQLDSAPAPRGPSCCWPPRFYSACCGGVGIAAGRSWSRDCPARDR